MEETILKEAGLTRSQCHSADTLQQGTRAGEASPAHEGALHAHVMISSVTMLT